MGPWLTFRGGASGAIGRRVRRPKTNPLVARFIPQSIFQTVIDVDFNAIDGHGR